MNFTRYVDSIILAAFTAAVVFAFSGCRETPLPEATIALETNSLTVKPGQTSFRIKLVSSAPFRIGSEEEWIICPEDTFRAGSHDIGVTAIANLSTGTRTGVIKFIPAAGSGVGTTFTLTQEGYKNISPDGNNILEFRFTLSANPGLSGECVCDIGDGTVEGVIGNLEDSPRNLVAEFVTDGHKVYVNGVEQVSGVTANDFSRPVLYQVVSDDGKMNNYAVRIRHFTGLPVLYINTASGRPVVRRSEWEKATMRLYGGLDFDDMETQEIEIKGRGNATWTAMQQKPSYNIRLDKRKEMLGMPEHRRWSLLANYRDKTLLRNPVSYFIGYQSTGLEWTSKYRDVEIIFNGSFAGVYQLTEQIRVDVNRVDIDELLPTDTDPQVITGGYLVEFDQYEVAYDESYHFKMRYLGRTWDEYQRIQVIQKKPDKEDSNPTQARYFESYILEAEKALYDAYTATYDRERMFADVFEKYFDLPSVIDQWIVYEISGTPEPGNPNSYYMYKKRGDTKLYGGPLWDFDYRSFMPGMAAIWINRNVFWFKWMFESRTFVNAVKERWNILYPGLEEKVLGFIDAQAEYLDLSMRANWELHEPFLIKEYFNDVNGDEKMNYSAAINRMKGYVSTRLRWLDANINAL